MVKSPLIGITVKRPAVFIAAAVVAITFISTYIGKFTIVFAALIFSALIVSFVLKNMKLFASLVIIFAVSLNLTLTYNELNTVRNFAGKEVKGSFVVTVDSVTSGDNTVFQMESISGDLPKGVLLEPVFEGECKLLSGDIITSSLKLSDINTAYRKSYYSDGIYANSRIESVSFTGKTDRFYKLLGFVRRYIKEKYLIYSQGDAGALLIAITIGDKSYLSSGLASSISRIGVSHMVAVSGFHLAIILGNVFAVFNRFVKNRYLRFAFSLLAVLFIAGVCGFTKSILRAGSMFIISAAAVLFDRESDSVSSLLLSVPAVFLISPFSIFSVGFNLSVLATFALIYISPFFIDSLNKILMIKSDIFKSVVSVVLNSFFAVLYTMPAIIKSFGSVSIVSIFANLFLNYLVTMALVFGAFALVFSPIKWFSTYLFSIASWFSSAMIFIIKGFNQLPIVSLELGKVSYIISIVIILALTAFVFYYNNYLKGGLAHENGF